MAAAADYFLSQFDTSPAIQATLLGTDGKTPVNLTGATVRLSVKPANGAAVLTGGLASIVGDPTLGVVRYQWQPVDVALAGMFNAEWIVTFPGGHEMTWPNDKYLRIEIKARLDPGDTPPVPSPLVGTIAVDISLDGVNTGAQQLVALSTTNLANGSRAWTQAETANWYLLKTGAFTPLAGQIVAGLNGGQWLREGFAIPVTVDPSVSPGLALPIGFRVRKADGSAAWDKFGTGATNWALVANASGTDQTARDAAAAAQTAANTALVNAATAEADAQTAITLASRPPVGWAANQYAHAQSILGNKINDYATALDFISLGGYTLQGSMVRINKGKGRVTPGGAGSCIVALGSNDGVSIIDNPLTESWYIAVPIGVMLSPSATVYIDAIKIAVISGAAGTVGIRLNGSESQTKFKIFTANGGTPVTAIFTASVGSEIQLGVDCILALAYDAQAGILRAYLNQVLQATLSDLSQMPTAPSSVSAFMFNQTGVAELDDLFYAYKR